MGFPVYQDTERKNSLLPNGSYLAEIVSCEEKPSKAGNPMWSLRLVIEEEVKASVFDHILLTSDFAWKMKGLCDALGAPYDGNLNPSDVVGHAVSVVVGTKNSEQYGKQNTIDSYIPKKQRAAKDDDPFSDTPF